MVRVSLVAGWPGVWLVMATLASSAQAGKIQFAVAEVPGIDVHGDSYVITIDESRPDLISHARALIDWVESGGDPANSPGGTIIVAPVASGSDGINRDVLAAGEPLWSWHVVGDPEFMDVTAEVLDGWPTFVEGDVPGWIGPSPPRPYCFGGICSFEQAASRTARTRIPANWQARITP